MSGDERDPRPPHVAAVEPDWEAERGIGTVLTERVTRVLAPNPSPMTGPGTNTYVVGTGPCVVIDPGPDEPAHVDAILATLAGRKVQGILVTHHHRDHWPAAVPLREATGARIYGHGVVGEFRPTSVLPHGGVVVAGGARLRAVHTPGHAADHSCFLLEEEHALFSGDHVMAGSTVVIAPPDGDMAKYLSSLAHLQTLGLRRIYPAHGHVLDNPDAVLRYYIDHRLAREGQVIEALRAGDGTVDAIVERIYAELPEVLRKVARYSVLSHLIKLRNEERAVSLGDDDGAPVAHAPRDPTAPPESWKVLDVPAETIEESAENPEIPAHEPPGMHAAWSLT